MSQLISVASGAGATVASDGVASANSLHRHPQHHWQGPVSLPDGAVALELDPVFFKTLRRALKVGLFGIVLDTYWPQFKGLKRRLEGYVHTVEKELERPGVEVVNLGLIDNPMKALEAGQQFREADVDLISLHVTTYALSSTVLPVVRRARVPVIILNLQPSPAIDYAAFNQMGDRTRVTGEWLGAGMDEPRSRRLGHLAPDLAALPDQRRAGMDRRASADGQRFLPPAQAVGTGYQLTPLGRSADFTGGVSK